MLLEMLFLQLSASSCKKDPVKIFLFQKKFSARKYFISLEKWVSLLFLYFCFVLISFVKTGTI